MPRQRQPECAPLVGSQLGESSVQPDRARSGGVRQLGRCPGLRRMAERQGAGRALSLAERIGMGVRGARRRDDALLVGRRRRGRRRSCLVPGERRRPHPAGGVEARERLRSFRYGRQRLAVDGGLLRRELRRGAADGGGCLRVDRGGSWFYPAWLLRSATRERNPADYRDAVMGFRVAPTLADSLGAEVRRYLPGGPPRGILEHIQINDGTGAAPGAAL